MATDTLAYVLVTDNIGRTHKCAGNPGTHSTISLCGVDLSGRTALPRPLRANRGVPLYHCQACGDAHDVRVRDAIVAAGGRGSDCQHGYGPLDSCPCCD